MARTQEWASRSLGIRWPGGLEYLGEAGLALGHKDPQPQRVPGSAFREGKQTRGW